MLFFSGTYTLLATVTERSWLEIIYLAPEAASIRISYDFGMSYADSLSYSLTYTLSAVIDTTERVRTEPSRKINLSCAEALRLDNSNITMQAFSRVAGLRGTIETIS